MFDSFSSTVHDTNPKRISESWYGAMVYAVASPCMPPTQRRCWLSSSSTDMPSPPSTSSAENKTPARQSDTGYGSYDEGATYSRRAGSQKGSCCKNNNWTRLCLLLATRLPAFLQQHVWPMMMVIEQVGPYRSLDRPTCLPSIYTPSFHFIFHVILLLIPSIIPLISLYPYNIPVISIYPSLCTPFTGHPPHWPCVERFGFSCVLNLGPRLLSPTPPHKIPSLQSRYLGCR